MYFIQESDKLNWVFELFNIVKLQNNKIILPIVAEDWSSKESIKLAKKTIKILEKLNSRKIIVSKQIKKQEEYINYLYQNQYDIIDGIWLFEILAEKVLDYIVNKKKLDKQEIQLSILVNDISEFTIEIINNLIHQFKKINIVTNHIEKFENIENKIFEEEGIIMAVTNNKRKSLSKSEIILNIDFPTELINKYNIYDNAIIVNIRENVKIVKKRFNGLNINDYEIEFFNIDELDNIDISKFYGKDIYEAYVYQKQPYKNIVQKLTKNKVEIKYLVASNSKL